jgi:amino acid transporter
MDYLLNPTICIVWCSKGMMEFLPQVPFLVWAVLFFLLFTGLNLRGVRTSARFNTLMAGAMSMVILVFLAAAVRYILGHVQGGTEPFIRPFYDREHWSTGAVLAGTSVAVLTYIGFDGISTLSEEVENPRRNVLLATVLTCLLIGVLSTVEVYAAQLLHPEPFSLAQKDTAFAHAAGRAGSGLFSLIIVTLLVANGGSGTGALLGAGRLLYGMGRSGALPPRFFGYLDPKNRIPRNNVIAVGVVALVGALLLEMSGGYDLGAQLLNFGAFIAFIGVNIATFVHYFLRQRQRTLGNFLPPLAGAAVCLLLWLNLSALAKALGIAWLAIGVAFGAWKTRGFRTGLVSFDIPPETT